MREIENPEMEGECELLLGEADFDAGLLPSAKAHFVRSLDVCREGADKRGQANAQWRLGEAALVLGDYEAARWNLDEALRAFHDAGMWKEMLGCLGGFAGLARLAGMPETAVRIAAAGTVARQRLGLIRRPAAESRWQTGLDVLRDQLGERVLFPPGTRPGTNGRPRTPCAVLSLAAALGKAHAE